MKIQTELTWTYYPGAVKIDPRHSKVLHVVEHCGRWAVTVNQNTAYVELVAEDTGHSYKAVVNGSEAVGFTNLHDAQICVLESLPDASIVRPSEERQENGN